MDAMSWVFRNALLRYSVVRPYVSSFEQIADHQLAVCDLLVTERSLVCCPVFIGNALMLYSFVDPVCLVSHTRPRRRPCSSVAAGVGRGG